MVVIRGVSAKSIFDSRREKTIFVSVKTAHGIFSASSPNGKSRGKYEAKPYKTDLAGDIKKLKQFSRYFSDDDIEKFDDLRRIEDIVDGHVGANTMLALESATLKALAREQRKQIWQLINPQAKRFPRFVGNCIGGGEHSHTQGKKPDFQEFLLIPNKKTARENFDAMKATKKESEWSLRKKDPGFRAKKNDEDAWQTSLGEKEVFDVLSEFRIPLGTDVAASTFYRRKKYLYQNPVLARTPEEQLAYISNLIRNFNLFYVEDPFDETDFANFGALLKKFPDSLIVGDDLTVTNPKRLDKAIEEKAINAVIVKPNQNGSLLAVKEVCKTAGKHGIKTVFSHRSGETTETILADLAFGFQADFLKCGITGKEREAKIRRIIEIERSLKR